jgi:hypothetical protein
MMDGMDLRALFTAADGLLFPPAHAGDLAALLQRARRDLKIDPPDDYMAFLRQSDGAVADGLMLYGSRRQRAGEVELPELVDINLRRRAYRDDADALLQLGEFDDDLIVFRSAEGDFCCVDRPSGDCHRPAAGLRQLVEALIGAD